METLLQHRHAATASWRKGRKLTPPITGLQAHKGGVAEKEVTEDTKDYNRKCVLFQPHHFRCVLRSGAPEQDRG
jgi:hypothetical protein